MPTGNPDFNAQPANSVTSQTYDPGEASNHQLMGGGNSSRSGRWIWATGYETGANSDYGVTGVNPPAPSKTIQAWQGSYALFSQTQAIFNDENSIIKYFPMRDIYNPGGIDYISPYPPLVGTYGLETMFAVGTNNIFINMILGWKDFNFDYQAGIQIDIQTGVNRIYYINNVGGGTILANANIRQDLGFYNSIKFVVDFDNKTYKHIIFNGLDLLGGSKGYKLTGFLQNPASTYFNYLYFKIANRSQTSALTTMALDNTILTADEP